MKSLIVGLIGPLTLAAVAGAQLTGDHLRCYKIRDPQPRATYTADLGGLAAKSGCIIQTPPKMACVPATATNIQPPPPGGSATGTPDSFFCYKAKCPATGTSPFSGTDQFGGRTVTVGATTLLCAPMVNCTPTTCAAAGKNCGTIADGCGGTLDCGSCSPGQICGGNGVPNVCGGGSSSCGTATPPAGPLGSTCTLPFPPPAAIPCSIATPGTQYYVDAGAGDDANSGVSPSRPWKTLCRAVSGAAPGSTIRVAAGTYPDGTITVGNGLTVKGGYDSTFSNWDPVANPTFFHGRLTLSDNAAVWGGFRMTSHPASTTWCDTMHTITAGTLVDNYIEIVYTSLSSTTQCAELIDVQPEPGSVARLACNDIYVRGDSPTHTLGTTAVELYALGGDVAFDSNRVCLDNYANKWFAETVSGYGTCGSGTIVSTLALTNNIIENAASGYAVGSFYGCGHDLKMVLTNNTIVTNGDGITGYAGDSGGVVDWKLTNNIVARSPNGSGSGIQLGTNPGVVVSSAAGNLVFGFGSNAIAPVPALATQNDTSGAWNPSQVFVNRSAGNYRLVSSSPGIGSGIDVYGMPAYGSVVADLLQQPRPASGVWDRGALKY